MKRILIGSLIFVFWLACVIALAFALHFSAAKFALFCIVLGLLGGATIAFAIWYISRMGGDPSQTGGLDFANLDALLRDADRKLGTSRVGVKSLASAQIIYMVGEDNSAKTQTVLQSGLDAELLAGNLLRDGVVAPTQLANIWLAGSSIIVEAGGALLQQPALWQRLIKATRPSQLGSLFSKAGSQPPRAVVVCVSSERIPGPSEAGYDANKIRASAQSLNERLRQLSETLGISVPVYVLFTKIDTLTHFADYVSRLSTDEVKEPLGSVVAQIEAGSGLYAERAAALVSTRLDELTYTLSEFRLEVLSRGGDLKMLASAYEFPRDLQKRRATIVDFLVELTRPSQLGINPFLRGFFFSGMRAVIVEDVASAPAPSQATMPVASGATSVFSIGGGQMPQPRQEAVRYGSRKVPQWAFLPHLFSKLLLTDKSAFEASRSSTKVSLLKRALLAGVCGCIVVYLVLLAVSFINNYDLKQQESAAATTPVEKPSQTQLASLHDLQTLDQLGTLLLKLDSYRKDGQPLMYGWGLGFYSTDVLYPITCKAYSTKFQALLLGPTQDNILARLRALPSPAPVGADYGATYKPLKAYLITTSNPEKSAVEPGFLAPVLTTAWAGAAAAPDDLNQLAHTQFETYARVLSEPQSCMATIGGRVDVAARDHAREYLNGLGGDQHVYLSMLADAGKQSQSIQFNAKFPGSARYIVDTYEVPGAFTKTGFVFMQNAIQHPEPYYKGEEWVLGTQSAATIDPAVLTALLQKHYTADYLTQWRSYLNAAKFVGFQNWNDAAGKLNALDSPSSAILQLFSLISINTSVAQPDVASAFQAPQSVVPPTTPPDRFIADANRPYITGIQGLEQAVKAYTQNASSATDPNAATPIIQAATTAEQAVGSLRIAFNPDPEGRMDTISFNRLEDPIKAVQALAHNIDPTGGAGKAFCTAAEPILNKFPLNPKSTSEASTDEVAQLFSPVQGALDHLYSKIGSSLVNQGGQYVPASGTQINPKFVTFFNAAEKVEKTLFPSGGSEPSLDFTLTEARTVPDAVLTIDGTQLKAGQTVTFHWHAKTDSSITLTSAKNGATPGSGQWSAFHLGLNAYSHPTSNSFVVGLGPNASASEKVTFDVSGPGAQLLNPGFMNQLHCVSTIAKP
jgi:type VI secretion system protein ImpL